MEEIRKILTQFGKKIVEKGLVAGPGGNISAREGEFVYLSPSGYFLDEIKEEEWVKVNIETGEIYSDLKPTCEISMHLGIYLERKDVKAVFHTHPPITVGLISSGVKFKPFFPEFVVILGRNVPVVEYVIPAGKEIREVVVREIKKANVVLLKNHGIVAVGESIKEAYTRSLMVEEAAKSLLVGIIAGKMRYFTKREIEQLEKLEAEDYRKALLKKSK
ncbi:MAG: class II aldolase/adducin family protein [Candidatus Omnitrophica bacterium]|nr:class II aldolase/adducin family protein [Candidatus Omnitrophota bacterium]MCM8807167.1 class II aldolase/adducin family protein [Candidatus Omnitrophota bacterium]